MGPDPTSDSFFSWNPVPSGKKVMLYDETLRDGLQSSSVRIPDLEGKTAILDAMDRFGIQTACLGFPAVSQSAKADCIASALHIRRTRLRLRPTLVARTLEQDITPVFSVCEKSGISHEVLLFLGVGYARQFCENWEESRLIRMMASAVDLTAKNGLATTFVIEDAARTHPGLLETFFKAAVDNGASRLILTDTVGAAEPSGVRAMVTFVRDMLASNGFREAGLDFHGHMDRGLGVVNSLAAIEAGVDRVHACAMGAGERCGNTPMEQLLLNLHLSGCEHNCDLAGLPAYCGTVATRLHLSILPIPLLWAGTPL